jgi:PKD repeat protein
MDKQIITVDMEINFTNCSENADSWLWDFGDGSTSAAFSPQHTYTQEGTYRISLTAFKDKKQNMAFYDVNILPKTD